MTRCTDCYAEILFVQLDTGSRIPVNQIPDPAGNVAAHRPQPGAALVGFVVARDHHADPDRDRIYMPHKATCKSEEERPRVGRKDRAPSLFDDTDMVASPPPPTRIAMPDCTCGDGWATHTPVGRCTATRTAHYAGGGSYSIGCGCLDYTPQEGGPR